ncbi:MAG TPA: hypothetical protein VFN88_14160 [Caulobacteraceae bacterium]|nr:hypothetical protein [Caulobacteraceae bacterium]
MNKKLIAALALTACALSASAFATSAAAAGYKGPVNIFGQPDLSGNWTNATLTPLTRPAEYGDRTTMTPAEAKKIADFAQAQVDLGNKPTDPKLGATVGNEKATGNLVGGYNRGWLDPGNSAMYVAGQPRTSILTTPDGQIPPRKGQTVRSAARRQASITSFAVDEFGGAFIPREGNFEGGEGGPAGKADNPEDRSPADRCLSSFGRNAVPPMLSNGFYNNNYSIIQNRDEVVIVQELVHDVRHIRLNTKQHLPDNIRPWLGDSVGWYEGDTLVVETTNIPQIQQFMGSWKTLKVTERFKRVAPERILYQFSIEDPAVWDKPWGGEYEFADLHGQVYEYACHEGNYALEGILAGARQQEQAAAKRAASP